MRIVLVRHGETEWSASGQHTSTTDLPLTERGREAAPRAAASGSPGASSRSCSPRRAPRARETARLAGFDREVDPDLAEIDYGAYEGLTTPEIREERPGWSLWRDGSPGGETLAQAGARADRVIARALAAGRRRRAVRPRPHPARARRALARAAAGARRELRARHRVALRARLRAREPRAALDYWNSTSSGAWSEGFGPLRKLRSIPHSTSRYGERRRQQDRVDPQPHLLVEVPGAVVPPGEAGLVGVQRRGRRRRCRRPAAREALALGRGDVGLADERRRVVDVEVGRADVEVARDDQRRRLAGRGCARPRRPGSAACPRRTASRPRGRWGRRWRRPAARRPSPPASAPRRRRARPRARCARRSSSTSVGAAMATPAQRPPSGGRRGSPPRRARVAGTCPGRPWSPASAAGRACAARGTRARAASRTFRELTFQVAIFFIGVHRTLEA